MSTLIEKQDIALSQQLKVPFFPFLKPNILTQSENSQFKVFNQAIPEGETSTGVPVCRMFCVVNYIVCVRRSVGRSLQG